MFAGLEAAAKPPALNGDGRADGPMQPEPAVQKDRFAADLERFGPRKSSATPSPAWHGRCTGRFPGAAQRAGTGGNHDDARGR